MSTQATGDGEPSAVDAAGQDEDAERAESGVTAAAEPMAVMPDHEAPDETAALPDEAAAPNGAAVHDRAAEARESPRAIENAAASEPDKDDGASQGDRADAPDEPGGDAPHEPGEDDETDHDEERVAADELGERGERESGEADDYESDEDYEDYEDYEDDGALEGDEALGYDEDYEDYGSDETAGPRRARRWPRVLLACGFVVLAAAIVGGAVAIVGSVTHGFKKPVKVTYTKSPVFSLKTGDCFNPQGQSYTLVSCDSPHVAEVFGTFTLPGTKWPGDAAAQAAASSGCSTRLTGYLNPQLAISLSSTYVYPDSVAWQAGTRTVICEVRASSGELTGSVRGAATTAG